MATIKSFTSLEQSRKLAEILPIESADMCYLPTHIGDEHHFIASLSPYSVCTKMTDVSIKYCTPCWSLAALLGVFEDKGFFYKLYFDGVSNVLEVIDIDNPGVHEINDNDYPIDACVAMIEKLHKLNLL